MIVTGLITNKHNALVSINEGQVIFVFPSFSIIAANNQSTPSSDERLTSYIPHWLAMQIEVEEPPTLRLRLPIPIDDSDTTLSVSDDASECAEPLIHGNAPAGMLPALYT